MNDELPKKKRRWIPIVLGVLLLLFVVAAGALVFTISWFRQNMAVTQSTEAAAVSQFDEVLKRFPGQQPLIQLVDNHPQYVPERATRAWSSTPLTTLHVVAFDRDEGKVVTFALPFWILRMKSGPIRISAYQQGWDDRGVSFRVEDIEKHGPGIIIDASEPGEGRVLIWAE
ncbi:MAG: hypothetical protein ABI039_07795 [Vicinamibacterales bacterium]